MLKVFVQNYKKILWLLKLLLSNFNNSGFISIFAS